MRKKKCKHCKEWFTPDRPMQTTCSYQCAIELAREKQRKAVRKRAVSSKELLERKDIPELKKRATAKFNAYIRLRDKDLPCVSCGYTGDGRQWHAGHYKPTGGYSYLRYDEANTHRQCVTCNAYKSGNLVPYREELIRRIGIEEVERLEQPNQIKRWTAEELFEIIEKYTAKIKELS